MKTPAHPEQADHFLVWPACALIVAIFAVGALFSFSDLFFFWGIPALALVVSGWLLLESVRAALEIRRRKWRRLASLPVILGGLYLGALPLMEAGSAAGDYIHLVAYYPYYIARIKASGDGQASAFRWSSTGFGGVGNADRTLVYDASGEFGRAVGSEKTKLGRKEIRHLIGSFYLVIDWYD